MGNTIKVKVSFTDDRNNAEARTSLATTAVLATVPTQPLSLTVATGDEIQELDASWQAPSSNGGSSITGYKVQWKRSADSWDTEADVSETTVTGTAHTITGLTDGVEYTVRVKAVNDVGEGPPSAEASGTPEEAPIWSTTLTVGVAETFAGYTTFLQDSTVLGALSSDTITLDDASYTVKALGVLDGKLILSVMPKLAAGFVLVVGTDEFTSTDASTLERDSIIQFQWNDPGLDLPEGEEVAVRLTEPEENTPATGLPTISGTPQVDLTLTADTSPIADADGLTNATFEYQWIAGGSDIDGATGSSYLLTSNEQGQTIQVRVSFTDDRNNAETLTSVATVAVAAAANREATGAPTISGTPQVDQTLTVDTSPIADEDGLTNVSYSYQWIAGESDIDGATGSTYTLTYSEQGQTVQVRASFTDDRNNAETLTSVATVAVAAAANREATGAPTLSGTSQVGETLTVDTSPIADEDGLTSVSYRYQWITGGSDIGGATGSTYTLTASEQGQTIQVRVTFADDLDNAETLTSAATAEVTPAPLTASLPDSRFQSARHNGADDRPQVIVAFSLPVASFEKTTSSVSLTGATVSSVRLHEEDGLENAWIFFLDPDGDGDIVFSLATGQPCDSGGICTEDGGMLSEGVQVTLPGPEEKEQEEAGDDQQTPESPPAKPSGQALRPSPPA